MSERVLRGGAGAPMAGGVPISIVWWLVLTAVATWILLRTRQQKEFEAIIAVVIGGTLLTGGYGSAIGAALGSLIFGTVQMGIFYTGIDTDWFKVFLGVMVLIAVLFNNYIRRKATTAR